MTKFFYLTFSTLVLLGVWQVIHLRSYFKKSASPRSFVSDCAGSLREGRHRVEFVEASGSALTPASLSFFLPAEHLID